MGTFGNIYNYDGNLNTNGELLLCFGWNSMDIDPPNMYL